MKKIYVVTLRLWNNGIKRETNIGYYTNKKKAQKVIDSIKKNELMEFSYGYEMTENEYGHILYKDKHTGKLTEERVYIISVKPVNIQCDSGATRLI